MNLSVSQIDAYRRCPRRWYLQWVRKIEVARPAYMRRGGDAHKEVETYLVTGILPTADPEDAESRTAVERAIALLPYLPAPPHPRELVEARFAVGEMIGYLDLIDWLEDGTPRVTDHKFRYDASEYLALPEDELRARTDALIYTLAVTEGAVASRMRWLVCSTKTLRVTPVEVGYDAGQALDLYLEHVEPLACEMLEIRAAYAADPAGHDPATVPDTGVNNGECKRYGGCPYRTYCVAWGTPCYGGLSTLLRGGPK